MVVGTATQGQKQNNSLAMGYPELQVPEEEEPQGYSTQTHITSSIWAGTASPAADGDPGTSLG
ncbi:hypothetical protein KC19_2G076600 [Ceratodon purpureus]|uniref:Uncharacterized protein n=1 Tax=Ceratodon purpureus TaxID=3225 RepID=A0A8T0IR86_CERPU|nr:hypothetical protein KC19_2G076600 [Ceratodon purpureus]